MVAIEFSGVLALPFDSGNLVEKSNARLFNGLKEKMEKA